MGDHHHPQLRHRLRILRRTHQRYAGFLLEHHQGPAHANGDSGQHGLQFPVPKHRPNLQQGRGIRPQCRHRRAQKLRAQRHVERGLEQEQHRQTELQFALAEQQFRRKQHCKIRRFLRDRGRTAGRSLGLPHQWLLYCLRPCAQSERRTGAQRHHMEAARRRQGQQQHAHRRPVLSRRTEISGRRERRPRQAEAGQHHCSGHRRLRPQRQLAQPRLLHLPRLFGGQQDRQRHQTGQCVLCRLGQGLQSRGRFQARQPLYMD